MAVAEWESSLNVPLLSAPLLGRPTAGSSASPAFSLRAFILNPRRRRGCMAGYKMKKVPRAKGKCRLQYLKRGAERAASYIY